MNVIKRPAEILRVSGFINGVPQYSLIDTSAAPSVSLDKPVIVFIHGWPDDEHIWDQNITSDLTQSYTCLLLRIPHFGGPQLKLFSRWGYSIDSLVDMFAMAIQCAVGKESLAKFGGVHLVIHDWGSVFGYQLQDRYPHLVKTIVSLDVGPMHSVEKPGLQDLKGWIMMGIAYQYWLILAYLIANLIPFFGPSIGKWLTIRTMASLSGGKIKIVSEDDFRRRANGYMNFPYLFLHMGNMLKLLGYSYLSKGTGSSKSGVKKCPIMFIYGTKKKMQFFSNAWLQEIQKIDGNLTKGLDAVHWIQKETPVEFNKLLGEWLKITRNAKL